MGKRKDDALNNREVVKYEYGITYGPEPHKDMLERQRREVADFLEATKDEKTGIGLVPLPDGYLQEVLHEYERVIEQQQRAARVADMIANVSPGDDGATDDTGLPGIPDSVPNGAAASIIPPATAGMSAIPPSVIEYHSIEQKLTPVSKASSQSSYGPMPPQHLLERRASSSNPSVNSDATMIPSGPTSGVGKYGRKIALGDADDTYLKAGEESIIQPSKPPLTTMYGRATVVAKPPAKITPVSDEQPGYKLVIKWPSDYKW